MNHADHYDDISHHHKKRDFLLWGSGIILLISYIAFLLFSENISGNNYFFSFAQSIFELVNRMALGIVLAIFIVGALEKIPQKIIIGLLGKGGTTSGIIKAAVVGVLLDLCSHGILLVGMQFYKKGLSTGQTMAFLIASPWNSLSLTIILWSLIGLKWTLAFLVLSMIIAIVSGIIFNFLEKKGFISKNPYTPDIVEKISFKKDVKNSFKSINFTPKGLKQIFINGLNSSKMILRWIFFGIVLAAAVRTFISPENFKLLFGPTLLGLGLTLVVATILEVCSEGSVPLAADVLTRAAAPGNAFAFLMTGVSTDYTEIIAIKETTKSWKTALLLPLVTVPQVVFIALIINMGA